MPQIDYRARLQPKSVSDVLGPQNSYNLLFPLWATNGILFPYTPEVSTGYTVEYDQSSFIHSIYGYNAYIKSFPKPISIVATFTAQTTDEALYLLAVIHFFRTVTKSYFGMNPYNKAGTPPPTLLFNYLGDYQFNNTPVVVKDVDYKYEGNVDYVPVRTAPFNQTFPMTDPGKTDILSLPPISADGYTYVPTYMTMSIVLDSQYVPIKLRNEFNLDEFRQGKLLNKGYI